MNCIGDLVYYRYYKIYYIMLNIFGLWPHEKSKILRIQTFFYFTVFLSIIFFQLTTFITTTCDTAFIIKKLSYILPTIVYTLNYNSFYFNSKIIKKSMEHIRLDWNTFTDLNEIKIIEKYTFEAYVFSFMMFSFVSMAMCIFTLFETMPVTLDIIVPMNASRPRKIKMPFELFFDEEQYFLFYVSYEILVLSIGIFTTVTTGAFFCAIGRHSCATYKITSNLIQNTVTDHTLKIPSSQKIYFMYQNICRAVHIHRRTLRFINDLFNVFHIWYIPLVLIGVLSLSLNLFRLLNAIIYLSDYYELFTCFTMFYGHMMYMFIANFLGQSIIDHSAEIFNATYSTLWYMAPLPIQKLLLLMKKSMKNHKIIVGGIFVTSLEGFSTLVTSSISYFTVIYTIMMKQ